MRPEALGRGTSARDRSPAPCCEADCAGRRNADEWRWRRLTRLRSNQHGHGMAPRMWPTREDGRIVLPSDVPPTGWGRRAPDRRREEIRRLLALMGRAIAALYEDACRLLVTEPQLATASHLVAHLAREIESGLRELLTAMVPANQVEASIWNTSASTVPSKPLCMIRSLQRSRPQLPCAMGALQVVCREGRCAQQRRMAIASGNVTNVRGGKEAV
jgi:hypothetical protein